MKKITRKRLERFLETYRSDARVLDIGSGGSSYGRYFPNRLAVDIDPARKPDIVADVHALPFKDEEFPIVLCTEVLEHTIDPVRAISEMMRVLKKGGMLILTTRFVYPLHDVPHDYWRFTSYNLERLFGAWTIVELTPETDTFSAIAVLLQRIVFQTKVRGGRFTKAVLMLLAILLEKLDRLTLAEYGDINRKSPATHIMATGYYVAVRK